ncbi:HAD domain-containing protein [Pandoraea pnomenusa]|uniref:HAD domain-containing protein n=1 Tax=Pandoraea pnomenusa TaxID=93220 RepID=UPI000A6FAA60|nr:HAD domain-containing protein [Pandoraea pnomenusa]
MMSALLRFIGIRPAGAPTFARESLPATPRAPRWALERAPRGPVLMLDIDGVLHPGQSGTLIYLPLLETWLRAHPMLTCDFVNWRETHALDELRNFFSIELRERVIGCTPSANSTRLDEIFLLSVSTASPNGPPSMTRAGVS